MEVFSRNGIQLRCKIFISISLVLEDSIYVNKQVGFYVLNFNILV